MAFNPGNQGGNVPQPGANFGFPPNVPQSIVNGAYPPPDRPYPNGMNHMQFPPANYVQPHFVNPFGYPQMAPQYNVSVQSQFQPPNNPDERQSNGSKSTQKSSRIETRHNKRFNLNPLLCDNILQSDYFQNLTHISSVDDVINETVKKVVHIEPTALGHTLLPSTAFCLLYKLFQFCPTRQQITSMMDHSNCYVKGIAFIYLRYLLPPKQIWEWFEAYLDEESAFVPGGDGKIKTNIGRFVENLIVEQKFYGTIFPRIPVPILREFKKKLLLRQRDLLENERKKKFRKKFEIGSKVEALYDKDGKWYKAKIEGYNSKSDNFCVKFKGYGQAMLPIAKLRPLKKSGESKDRRNPSKSKECEKNPSRKRGRSRENSRHRRRKRSRSRSRKRRRSRSRSTRHRDRKGRERDREDHRGRNRVRDEKHQLDRELERLVKEKDKEDASAVGRHYASRPVSYKSCLSVPMQIMTTRERSLTPPTRPSRRKEKRDSRGSEYRSREESRNPPSKEYLEKIVQLKQIYGDASAKKD